MMVVQAEAGPVAVEHDPARAAGAFEAIAATGRQALVEMRRLLGMLRGGEEQAPSLAPQPGLAEVPSLVEQVGGPGSGSSWWSRARRRPCRPGSTCPPTGSSRRP
jgi:hypothetical protein